MSNVAAWHSLRLHFNLQHQYSVTSAKAIKIWITYFEKTDSALKNKPVQKKTINTLENIGVVKATFIES